MSPSIAHIIWGFWAVQSTGGADDMPHEHADAALSYSYQPEQEIRCIVTISATSDRDAPEPLSVGIKCMGTPGPPIMGEDAMANTTSL